MPFGLQGAFILVGNSTAGVGYLVVMAVGVLLYSCWRYWEGITGQGSDASFGPYKNFFRYRLSSLVSVRALPALGGTVPGWELQYNEPPWATIDGVGEGTSLLLACCALVAAALCTVPRAQCGRLLTPCKL